MSFACRMFGCRAEYRSSFLAIARTSRVSFGHRPRPMFAVATLLTTYPVARLSDRVGRKPLIYASCAIGSLGQLGIGLAPNVVVTIAFAVIVGVARGVFLAVDWALMTELIPKATSGR